MLTDHSDTVLQLIETRVTSSSFEPPKSTHLTLIKTPAETPELAPPRLINVSMARQTASQFDMDSKLSFRPSLSEYERRDLFLSQRSADSLQVGVAASRPTLTASSRNSISQPAVVFRTSDAATVGLEKTNANFLRKNHPSEIGHFSDSKLSHVGFSSGMGSAVSQLDHIQPSMSSEKSRTKEQKKFKREEATQTTQEVEETLYREEEDTGKVLGGRFSFGARMLEEGIDLGYEGGLEKGYEKGLDREFEGSFSLREELEFARHRLEREREVSASQARRLERLALEFDDLSAANGQLRSALTAKEEALGRAERRASEAVRSLAEKSEEIDGLLREKERKILKLSDELRTAQEILSEQKANFDRKFLASEAETSQQLARVEKAERELQEKSAEASELQKQISEINVARNKETYELRNQLLGLQKENEALSASLASARDTEIEVARLRNVLSLTRTNPDLPSVKNIIQEDLFPKRLEGQDPPEAHPLFESLQEENVRLMKDLSLRASQHAELELKFSAAQQRIELLESKQNRNLRSLSPKPPQLFPGKSETGQKLNARIISARTVSPQSADKKTAEQVEELKELLGKRTEHLLRNKEQLLMANLRLIGALSELERLRGIKFRVFR